MQENEMQAIKLLRSLIQTEERAILPSGRIDGGWCCTDHALAACIMFTFLGRRVSLCEGSVIIGNRQKASHSQPHEFVFLEDFPEGIFDSSITHLGVKGIPRAFAGVYNFLDVGLFTVPPSARDFLMEHKEGRKPLFALYHIDKKATPTTLDAHFASTTPFGQWLSTRFDSQEGIWEKVGFCAAEAYAGRATLNHCDSQESLWESVMRTPDKRDAFRESLLKLGSRG